MQPSAQYISSAQKLTKQLFLGPRIISMTNLRIKYTSCVSKIARETDLEIKIAKNTQKSLRKVMQMKLEL